MEDEELRVKQSMARQIEQVVGGSRDEVDSETLRQRILEAGAGALEQDAAYQQGKQESDRHVCNWYCQYQGNARVDRLVGYGFAEAMKPSVDGAAINAALR